MVEETQGKNFEEILRQYNRPAKDMKKKVTVGSFFTQIHDNRLFSIKIK